LCLLLSPSREAVRIAVVCDQWCFPLALQKES
jgi:hypothetical protein